MMPALTAPWRLAVHNDARTVLGTGFLVAPRLALTCAHVVAKNRSGDLWVQCGGPRAVPARVHPTGLTATQGADVALLELEAPVDDIAPAIPGPAEPPPVGALLAAFGFPRMSTGRGSASRERRAGGGGVADDPGRAVETGIWVPVGVDGYDLTGERIQLTSRSPHGVPVQHGFSGGPVIDPQSDLVVGMISDALAGQPTSLMIPIRILAACSPELRAILMPGALADREFSEGLVVLDSGNYPAALAAFRAVCARHPENADTWYYVTLAALRGQRPRAHAPAYIGELSALLAQAASLSPAGPHVLALWALIKEDHYRVRGMSGGDPTVEDLRRASSLVSPAHATEICRHVPAPETGTWQEINHRRNH
jgi:S1-C subfamily serine protease